MDKTNRNYLYLYDLPKEEHTTSVRIAETFKKAGVEIGTIKPQIMRDMFKPFYSAIINISDPEQYNKAKEAMRYFDFGDKTVRSLPFDKELKGENKLRVLAQNVFYKLNKGDDKNQLTYKMLHEKFEQYGKIKSTKISLNPDFTNRGYAFVCFEDAESTKKCVEALGASGQVFAFAQKDPRDVGRNLSNNLYFKNVPEAMTEVEIKGLFEPFGTLKSLVVMPSELGRFGFVCYDDVANKSHGPEACQKAIVELNGKVLGKKADGKDLTLYVKDFLGKEERKKEKFNETIRYKNSKKRCNLYVKNFPQKYKEDDLRVLFQEYGIIERVKVDEKGTFAFVCFEKPDACTNAKQALSGHNIDGKTLVINHYEIKEQRDLQLEELRDKRDWERYISEQSNGQNWNQITSHPQLTHIITQLLQIMNTNQPQPFNRGPRQGQNHQGGQRREGGQNRPMQGQNRPMGPGNMMPGMNQQQQQPMQQQRPQGGMPVAPQQPMQPAAPQQMPAAQNANMSPQQKFLQAASQLLPSVQEKNPYLKEHVGHLIFDYVQMFIGQDKAPKITGMLIELPVQQIRQYLQSFEALQQRVQEANNLLNGVNPAQAQPETQQ